MYCVEVQVGNLLIVRNAFSGSKGSDKSSTFLKRDDLLMLRYNVSTVRNVDILAVLSSNYVDLLILKIRVLRQRNDQICAVVS